MTKSQIEKINQDLDNKYLLVLRKTLENDAENQSDNEGKRMRDKLKTLVSGVQSV